MYLIALVCLTTGASAKHSAQEATSKYLKLLDDFHWLDYIEGRVMASGWLGTDNQFATFGDGFVLHKRNDTITFERSCTGDNDGIFTGPVAQGVCHAMTVWPNLSDRLSPVLERLINGLSAWVLANRRSANDTAPTILARNLYPPKSKGSFGGYQIVLDYDAFRAPGGGTFSERVHVPQNPYWGDLWIEAKRSKDDIGHMFRGIAHILQPGGCLDQGSTSLRSAAERMHGLYAAWAAQVQSDHFRIATLDTSLNVELPAVLDAGTAFAWIRVGNTAECTGPLALHLLAEGTELGDCKDGLSSFEKTAKALDPKSLKNDNIEIFRSSHEAAAAMAMLQGRNSTAESLRKGLSTRLNWSFEKLAKGKYPSDWHKWDLTSLVLHSAALGATLSADAIDWFEAALDTTSSALAAAPVNTQDAFRIFDPAVPDGDYDFMPTLPRQQLQPGALGMADGEGLKIEDLLVPLGACGSVWRGSEALLDCEALRAYRPQGSALWV